MNEIIQLIPRNEEKEHELNNLSTYTEKYNFLVNYYKTFDGELTMYCEKHHILPRSLGGGDDAGNIVKLPASMHYVAHYYLPLVCEENGDLVGKEKMLYAFIMFMNKKRQNKEVQDLLEESKQYARLREEAINKIAEHARELNKDEKYREANKQRNIQRYIDNPGLRAECSIRAKKWMKEKPDSVELMKRKHREALMRPDVRQRISKAAKARGMSAEFRKRISEAQKRRFAKKEERDIQRLRMLGKQASAEARKKMSESQNKRYEDPVERQKCACNGERNGMYGRRGSNSIPNQMMWIKNEITGESKYIKKTEAIPNGWEMGRFNMYDRKKFAKMWITNGIEDKLVPKNDIVPDGWCRGKTQISSSNKGKVRITDGIHNKWIDKQTPVPHGWKVGTTFMKRPGGATTTGRFWINNGVVDKFCSGDIPSGWVKGRLPR